MNLSEVHEVLKGFVKDKSPRPDDWSIHLFLSFFDILGQDLVDVVYDSSVKGKVVGAINAIFIPLILKGEKHIYFNDYRAISLFNVVCKLISKIIAKILKPMMSRWMPKDQFGFLDNQKISDAIGVAQKYLHTIKLKKKKYLILKLDLVKAYDRVNCDFFRLGFITSWSKIGSHKLGDGMCKFNQLCYSCK